jgi:hypothetical protein
LLDHDGYGIAFITAELARERSQLLARDPLPDKPAHALVVGNKTTSAKRMFARFADEHWVVRPPGG